jgi:hypothetical protein
MSKMGLHDPFAHLKHKLWPKEGLRIKLAIWLPNTKSLESPWFPCVQVACKITLERSRRGLQLCFRPHFNRRFAHKVMAPKVVGIPSLGILGFPLGSLGTKWHLGAIPMARHKIYYKGVGGGFPQVRAMMSLVSPCLPVACPCTKVLQTLTNLLFGLCRSVRIIELLVNLLNPIPELQHAPIPLKWCELKNTSQLFLLPLSSPLDS